MATRDATNVNRDNGFTRVVTWTGLTTAADVGIEVPVGACSEISVQLSGTLGSSPNVFIEGSNDGVNWATLKDVHGTALSAVATLTALHQLAEKPLLVRPRLSATSGGSNINVVMVMRRPSSPRE